MRQYAHAPPPFLSPRPPLARYVDVALQLLERAGDFVSEDIWHRVVQLVTNNESMQQYAARNMVEVLKRGAAHEVRAGGCSVNQLHNSGLTY